jgi:hypothetical protein
MARQLLKEGTRLDGIPLNPRATYIVVARQSLDMAVSLYHQGSNNRPGQDARADLAAGACQAAAAAPAGARLAARLDRPRPGSP